MKIIGERPEREKLEVQRIKLRAAMYGWGTTLRKHAPVFGGDTKILLDAMTLDLSGLIEDLEIAEQAWQPIVEQLKTANAEPKARKRTPEAKKRFH